MTVLIVTSSYEAARLTARVNELKPSEWLYVSKPSVLWGRSIDNDSIMYGEHYGLHPQYAEIVQEVRYLRELGMRPYHREATS